MIKVDHVNDFIARHSAEILEAKATDTDTTQLEQDEAIAELYEMIEGIVNDAVEARIEELKTELKEG